MDIIFRNQQQSRCYTKNRSYSECQLPTQWKKTLLKNSNNCLFLSLWLYFFPACYKTNLVLKFSQKKKKGRNSSFIVSKRQQIYLFSVCFCSKEPKVFTRAQTTGQWGTLPSLWSAPTMQISVLSIIQDLKPRQANRSLKTVHLPFFLLCSWLFSWELSKEALFAVYRYLFFCWCSTEK